MSPLVLLRLLLIFTIYISLGQIQGQTYPTWMAEWSTSEASAYSVSIHTSTIYDIVLPGANNAGMSFLSTDSDPMTSSSTQDTYTNVLNSLPNIESQKQWAQRQTATIVQLLESGVRFLDLQLQHEADSDTFYAYNGLLGRSVTDIITDITDFLTNTGTQELILIYLHDFLYSGDSVGYIDGQLTDLLDVFATDSFISSHCANIQTDNIRSSTIGDLISNNIQIILFTDQYPNTYGNSDYFYDANTYLFLPQYDSNINASFAEGQLDEVSEVRSFVISNLRDGWPEDQLNLIYWTLDIGVSFTEQHIYASMQDFSSRLNNELNTVINTYNKLWFANVIIVDFFAISDIMEQILLLNYDYFTCKDSTWGNNGTGCPSETNLKSKYSTSDISPLCEINTDLQTQCIRSCGVCPSSSTSGNPGDICSSNADCDGILYGFYWNSIGECFVRPDTQRAQDNINQESFCLTRDAQISCTNHDVLDMCDEEESIVDVSNCNEYCTANWQCEDGFCNSEYSVCMTLLDATTTTDAPQTGLIQRYDFIVSTGAEQMLSDVAMFRPGDYEATPDVQGIDCANPGPNCMLDGMDANPYIASLLGFAVIPFIMAILLCFCYSCCCCPCWCICDKCVKKCCCCQRVMGNPIEDGNKCKQFTPLAFLCGCLIVIIWASIEGIVNNAEMHDHIFGDTNSVKYAVNNLFDEVLGRFNAVEPTAEYIIDTGIGIINDIFGILETNVDAVDGTLDDLYAKLDAVAETYEDGVTLSADFVNPFGSINISNMSLDQSFVVECDYCAGISDQVRSMKGIINSSIGSAIRSVDTLMNETQGLVDAKDMIKNLTSSLFETLNEVINTSQFIQNEANYYIDLAAEYDSMYREQPAMIFFIIPMGLIIFVVLGVLMKNKWCFKCEWFCAMYCCGIPIMLLSWPFIFFAVLWGDVCVRLDDFEQNLAQSQLGVLAGLDNPNITIDDPRSRGLALVNTCWHGGSPLEVFGNLTENLNWDHLREQMDEVLDIDITGMFENADISSFQTGIDTLSVFEFEGKVDSFIANANAVGKYCGCGERGSLFTWANLYTPPDFDYCAAYIAPNYTEPTLPIIPNYTYPSSYTDRTFYWMNTTLNDNGKCEIAFINASAAVQIYTILADEGNAKIAELKSAFGDAVFDTYDSLFEIAIGLEDDISRISCMIEPLFEQFDIIIDNFTNCGFLGEAYGNFKEAGCVNLFDDWYKIARAMAVIAYICILIVFLSLCMDHIYGPVTYLEELEGPLDEEIKGSDIDMANGGVVAMAPTAHEPGTSGGVELITVGQPVVQPISYVQQPMVVGTEPGQITNYNDAAPSVVGSYMASQPGPMYSVPSTSMMQASPPYDAQPYVGAVSYPPKPEVANSEVQLYAIGYDNEKGEGEGGAATTAVNINAEDAVVPPEPVASAPDIAVSDPIHPVKSQSDDYDVL